MTSSAEFYCLTSGLRALPAPGGGVFLVSEYESQHAASPLVAAVVALTDGTRNSQEIVSALPEFSAAEVIFALSRLRSQGVLDCLPKRATKGPGLGAVCEQFGLLQLISDNAAALALMSEALRGVNASELARFAAADLILCSDYLGPLPAEAVGRAKPWLPVKLVGRRSYFGPLFGADPNVCFACLQRRLRLNRPVETYHGQNSDGIGRTSFSEPLEIARAAQQTVNAVLEALSNVDASLPHIVEFGRDGRRHHAFICTCDDQRAPQTTLQDQTPIRRRLGGYRSRDVGDVLTSLRPLVSDLTGLISSAGALDTGATSETDAQARHVWAASYPIIPRAKAPALDAFHGVALGKGLSSAQAQASALCEAVERMSAQFPGDIETCRASFSALGEQAVHPNAVWQFSDAQFSDRTKWNALSRDDRRHVPEALDADREIDWVPVWSITKGRKTWMARDLCFANAPEPRFGRFDPNGCAAGSTQSEAAVQGLLELVERDSIAIWWYNRVCRPALDPLSVDDKRVRDLAQGFVDLGWDCWVLDITADLAIPCLAAVARAKSDGRWCIGFGCHFDSEVATERAMTELAQLFRADGRDGPPPWEPMNPADEAFLLPHGTATPQDAPTAGISTFGGLIDWSAQMLSERGIEMLILDQTRPDTKLPVVKVFAPGLRHFWPRFGPGRLYGVPAQMGWRDAPQTEDGLNQTHLFL